MNLDFDSALWTRLNEYLPDATAAERPFLAKFADEHPGIGLDGAREVWREYLRFVYLACRAGHPVSPSPWVDAVWHQHLCYSREYWGRFCPEVLQAELHHQPSRGGSEEARRHREQYEATLASYRRIFEEEQSRAWWPSFKEVERSRPRWHMQGHLALSRRCLVALLLAAAAAGYALAGGLG